MEGLDNFITSLDKYRVGMCSISELGDAHLVMGKFKNFEKYLGDRDIRAKDTRYSIVQEDALLEFVKLLKNKDYLAAGEVTFCVPTLI
jgi:hypothetical protein